MEMASVIHIADRIIKLVAQSKEILTPDLSWWRTYTKDDAYADIFAGVTVTIILVPQALALSLIAGLPAVYGLYAAMFGAVAAVWGSSNHLATGPVAITSFLVFTSLSPIAEPGTYSYIALAGVLAVLSGCIQLLIGVSRLGYLIRLIPQSAILGFSSAAAIIICITQVPALVGIAASRGDLIPEVIRATIVSLPHFHPITLGVGIISCVILLFGKVLPKWFPTAFVVLGASIAVSWYFSLGSFGVALVESFSGGLPSISLPHLTVPVVLGMLPRAAIISFIGFVGAYANAQVIARKTKQKIDTDRELVGQGLANIGAGLFKGFPVSGSFSRTALNVEAGARTPVASIVTALCTLVVIQFLIPLIALLPLATLAAVIIISTLSLIDIQSLKKITALDTKDGVVAWTTFGISFLLKPDDAVFIGVFLALVLFMHRTMKAQVVEVGVDTERSTLRALELDGSERVPHVLIVRPQMSLYYASAAHVIDSIVEKIDTAFARGDSVHTLVIDASGINMIDGNAIDSLEIFFADLYERSISVVFVYTRVSVQPILKRASFSNNILYAHNIGEMRAFITSHAMMHASVAPAMEVRV